MLDFDTTGIISKYPVMIRVLEKVGNAIWDIHMIDFIQARKMEYFHCP